MELIWAPAARSLTLVLLATLGKNRLSRAPVGRMPPCQFAALLHWGLAAPAPPVQVASAGARRSSRRSRRSFWGAFLRAFRGWGRAERSQRTQENELIGGASLLRMRIMTSR